MQLQEEMKNKKAIKIEMVGDFACPWCYIGLHEFQKATREFKDYLAIDFQWIPFEISPNVPLHGFERARHLTFMFGSQKRAAQIFQDIEKRAVSLGLHIDFSLIKKSPNTFHLHRLAWKAAQSGELFQLLEILFQCFFIKGIDLTSVANIATQLEKISWAPQSTKAFIESCQGYSEVIQAEREQAAQGVVAVPRFIINKNQYIDGAQSKDTWRKLLSNYSNQYEQQTVTIQL